MACSAIGGLAGAHDGDDLPVGGLAQELDRLDLVGMQRGARELGHARGTP